jgi:hypothetical protein
MARTPEQAPATSDPRLALLSEEQRAQYHSLRVAMEREFFMYALALPLPT